MSTLLIENNIIYQLMYETHNQLNVLTVSFNDEENLYDEHSYIRDIDLGDIEKQEYNKSNLPIVAGRDRFGKKTIQLDKGIYFTETSPDDPIDPKNPFGYIYTAWLTVTSENTKIYKNIINDKIQNLIDITPVQFQNAPIGKWSEIAKYKNKKDQQNAANIFGSLED